MTTSPKETTVADLLQRSRDRKKPPKHPDIAELISETKRLRAATRLIQCPFCSRRTSGYKDMHRHIISNHPRSKKR